MSKPLTVNNRIFDYPEPGDREWGEDATGWAEEVTEVLSTISPTGFIPETTATINDNVAVFTDVLGASFNSAITRSFRLTYSVSRTNGVSTIAETGVIEGVYNGTDWDDSIQRTGDAGVIFQVTAGGQVQYTSTSLGGTYSGDMKFFANVITA